MPIPTPAAPPTSGAPEHPVYPALIATGGLAALFDQHTAIFDALESDLTIQGLAMLYARSRSPK